MICCLFRKSGTRLGRTSTIFVLMKRMKSKLRDVVRSCYEIHATSREDGFLSNILIQCQQLKSQQLQETADSNDARSEGQGHR